MVTVEHGEQIAMTRVTCGHTAPGANRDEVTPSAHINTQGFKRYVACADADQRDLTDAGRMTQGEGSIPSEATRGGGSTRGFLSPRKAPETADLSTALKRSKPISPAGQRCPASPLVPMKNAPR